MKGELGTSSILLITYPQQSLPILASVSCMLLFRFQGCLVCYMKAFSLSFTQFKTDCNHCVSCVIVIVASAFIPIGRRLCVTEFHSFPNSRQSRSQLPSKTRLSITVGFNLKSQHPSTSPSPLRPHHPSKSQSPTSNFPSPSPQISQKTPH
jgi:hypothetical protein